MNRKIESMLLEHGASMVGFAKIENLYNRVDLSEPRSEDSVTEPINIPQYPVGISITLALPREVIRNITDAPTIDYYNAYHSLNVKLDELALICAGYLKE